MDSNTDSLLFNGNNDVGIAPTNENGFLEMLKNMSGTTWIIIILLLSFLGINIFHYLAQGTQEFTDIFKPFVKVVLELFAYISSLVVGVTAAGTKNIVQKTSGAIDKGLTKIENKAGEISSRKGKSKHYESDDDDDDSDSENNSRYNNKMRSNTQEKTPSSTTPTSLDSSDARPKQQLKSSGDPLDKVLASASAGGNDYEADDSTSKIQSGGGKSGWCYIGEDRGFRSCIEVGQSDTCMSENIYPNQDICVNPRLRN